ncbi:hypothetical protein ACFLYV_00915 [Chloroflexota bacterium]
MIIDAHTHGIHGKYLDEVNIPHYFITPTLHQFLAIKEALFSFTPNYDDYGNRLCLSTDALTVTVHRYHDIRLR